MLWFLNLMESVIARYGDHEMQIVGQDVFLTRVCTSTKGTFGVLSMDGIPLCVTCEEPWKNNQRKKSCIPDGEYEVAPYTSAKFPNVWEIQDVPDRSKILIHNGNTIKDIEGCIVVGRSFQMFGELPGVTSSKLTLEGLRSVLPKNFRLTIRWA